jgi:hypothetical protein
MDTINHYVGMYPIAAGGVVERAFSPFLISLLAVMLVGFAIPRPAWRVAVLAVGFGSIALWMWLYFYAPDGLRYQSQGYLTALARALDQSAEEQAEQLSPGEALIARLKAELEQATGKQEQAQPAERGDRERLIENLRASFERDQERRAPDQRRSWNGSGAQMLVWHYAKSLGRYFNNPAEIAPMADKMNVAAHAVFWVLIGLMLLLLWGARRNGGVWYWLLALAPLALPLFFLIDYSAWLWWYGHNLNEMGAFTVKPFMPTVFGNGKVAQFATHSYPDAGFGLMLLLSVCVALAALLRRKQWRT